MDALSTVAWVAGGLALVGLVLAAMRLRHSRTEGLTAIGLVVAIAMTVGGALVLAATIIDGDRPVWEQGVQIFAGLVVITSLLMAVRFAQALRRLSRPERDGG
ncbi:MAG: hypothetical protein GXX90_00715 [Microbacteriaceae bacterium]|nr:hypothetical protein [Microbacteriaceae bacterium]